MYEVIIIMGDILAIKFDIKVKLIACGCCVYVVVMSAYKVVLC